MFCLSQTYTWKKSLTFKTPTTSHRQIVLWPICIYIEKRFQVSLWAVYIFYHVYTTRLYVLLADVVIVMYILLSFSPSLQAHRMRWYRLTFLICFFHTQWKRSFKCKNIRIAHSLLFQNHKQHVFRLIFSWSFFWFSENLNSKRAIYIN